MHTSAAVAQHLEAFHLLRPLSDAALNGLRAIAAEAKVPREELWIGGSPNDELRRELAGFVVSLIGIVLKDHHISAEEQHLVRRFRFGCFLDGGALLQFQRESVAEIVASEMRSILLDARVDATEALRQVELQQALDIGYDDFHALAATVVRPLVESIVAPLRSGQMIADQDRQRAMSQLLLLNTVVRLDPKTLDLH